MEYRAGTANTNADCLSRHPLPSAANAPVLDRTKGEVQAPATFLAMMVGAAPSTDAAEEERDIWDDAEVLQFILTHKYQDGLSAKTRDRIYHEPSLIAGWGMGSCACSKAGPSWWCQDQRIGRRSSWRHTKGWGISEFNGS